MIHSRIVSLVIQWTRILEDNEINALISLSSILGTEFIFIFVSSSFSLNKNKYSNDTFTHCVFLFLRSYLVSNYTTTKQRYCQMYGSWSAKRPNSGSWSANQSIKPQK